MEEEFELAQDQNVMSVDAAVVDGTTYIVCRHERPIVRVYTLHPITLVWETTIDRTQFVKLARSFVVLCQDDNFLVLSLEGGRKLHAAYIGLVSFVAPLDVVDDTMTVINNAAHTVDFIRLGTWETVASVRSSTPYLTLARIQMTDAVSAVATDANGQVYDVSVANGVVPRPPTRWGPLKWVKAQGEYTLLMTTRNPSTFVLLRNGHVVHTRHSTKSAQLLDGTLLTIDTGENSHVSFVREPSKLVLNTFLKWCMCGAVVQNSGGNVVVFASGYTLTVYTGLHDRDALVAAQPAPVFKRLANEDGAFSDGTRPILKKILLYLVTDVNSPFP